ncbi:hypothetical protein Tco_1250987 [Tanacetum coccineum]
MTPRLDILFDFLKCDNMECKIRGISKVRIQQNDGSSFLLHNVRIRRDNCVYSLDDYAMVGELNDSVKEKDGLAQEGMGLSPQVQTRSIWKVQKVEVVSRESSIESGIARHLTVAGMPSPSRAIEKKTPMEMWSGHPSDYKMLRIFGCVAYPHDKQGDKSVKELQAEVELQRLSNHTPEEDQTDQEDADDEDAGD